MSIRITHLSVRDIRFPTSLSLDGSDAMNSAPTIRRPTWCCTPALQPSKATA